MRHAQGAFVGLIVWLVCLVFAQADTLSASGGSAGTVAASLDAVLSVEKQGLRRVDTRSIARLTRVPPDNPIAMTGYSKLRLASLPEATGGRQWQCLTEALYFEARGETVTGQFAVAEVIMNRVASPRFPDTVCGVVHQGSGRRHQCQFSFYCDGRAEVFSEPNALDVVEKVAQITLSGVDLGLTDGATFYHTKSVSPKWSKVFERTATIGYHHFYREPLRITSN